MSNKNWSSQTRMIHDAPARSQYGETSEAMFLTSGYVYQSAEQAVARFDGDDDGYIYSRFGNPTVSMFEQRMAALEGTEICYGTATGMAAVYAALACQLKQGDHVVAARVLFGSCLQVITNFLPKFGVEFTLVDGTDTDAWAAAIKPNTKVLFCESPANPTLDLADIKAIADLAHANKACLVVDNAFASPVAQNPTRLGADVVVYSATKHIDGQGRCLGGAICCSQTFFDDHLEQFTRHTGPSMSPFNAWVLGKSLETLDLRVERMCANARAVADFLYEHGAVEEVIYPGHFSHKQFELAETQMTSGGSMMAFKLAGGKAAAFATENKLELIKISNNLGDAKSLITHPATTTHRTIPGDERNTIGISENMLRLSVGLESAEDLIADMDQALTS